MGYSLAVLVHECEACTPKNLCRRPRLRVQTTASPFVVASLVLGFRIFSWPWEHSEEETTPVWENYLCGLLYVAVSRTSDACHRLTAAFIFFWPSMAALGFSTCAASSHRYFLAPMFDVATKYV